MQSLASYFTVVKVKAQIDQIVEGLNTLGVLNLLRANPRKGRQLLIYREPETLTADAVIDLFTPRYSPVGSNQREDEEQAVLYC